MKRQWLSIWDLWSSRINAWELHLRLLSFLSFIGVCLLLVFWLWLWPAQAVLKQLTDDALKQGDELQAMGDNLKAKAMPMDDDQALADQIAAVNIMLNLTNQALKNAQSLQTQIPLTQALFDVLRRYEGLVLLHKSTVTPDSPIDNSAQTETTVLPAGMTRQNVQLTVSGPYLELMLYVEALESQLPNIHWTSMLMKSGEPPTTLTLNLFEIAEYPR
tara:strand:- start:265 stop:915 length:651 start_codon:yes stop_codon:yes gene_type:complete